MYVHVLISRLRGLVCRKITSHLRTTKQTQNSKRRAFFKRDKFIIIEKGGKNERALFI